jgi:hypothetical protein
MARLEPELIEEEKRADKINGKFSRAQAYYYMALGITDEQDCSRSEEVKKLVRQALELLEALEHKADIYPTLKLLLDRPHPLRIYYERVKSAVLGYN